MLNIEFYYTLYTLNWINTIDIFYYNNTNFLPYDVVPLYTPFVTMDISTTFILILTKILLFIINYTFNIIYYILLLLKLFINYNLSQINFDNLTNIQYMFYLFFYNFLDYNTYKNSLYFYYYIIIILLIIILLIFCTKFIIELLFNFIYTIYLNTFILLGSVSSLPKWHFKVRPKSIIKKRKLYTYTPPKLFYIISKQINNFYCKWFQKHFYKFTYYINPFILAEATPFLSRRYHRYSYYRDKMFNIFFERMNIRFLLNNNIKFLYWDYYNMDKTSKPIITLLDLRFYTYAFLTKKYFQIFIPLYFTKFFKFLKFLIPFFFKYLLLKFFKYIIKFGFLSKLIHVWLYYIINIYIYIDYIINFTYLNIILSFYINFKAYIVYYINMFLHYYIYAKLPKFYFFKQHYNNIELYDNFPFYQSNFILYIFNLFKPKNTKCRNYNKTFILLYTVIQISISYSLNFMIKTFYYSIKFLYYIFKFKIYILYSLFNKKYIYFILVMGLLLCLMFILKNPLFVLKLLIPFLITYYINNYISLLYYIKFYFNSIIFIIGYLFFFIIDSIYLLNKLVYNLLFFLFRYFLFYSLFIFVIISILYNNPIIGLLFLSISKLILLSIFESILYILNLIGNLYRLTYLNLDMIITEFTFLDDFYINFHNNYFPDTFMNTFRYIKNPNAFKSRRLLKRIYKSIKFNIILMSNLLIANINYTYQQYLKIIYDYFTILYLLGIIQWKYFFTTIPFLFFYAYYTFLKFYYFLFIYYYVPSFILYNILDKIVFFYEYYFILSTSYMKYNTFCSIHLVIIYLKLIIKLFIINFIISLSYINMYYIYTFTIFIYKFLHTYFNIWCYFFIDFLIYLNLNKLILFLLTFTNIDFLHYININNIFNYKNTLYTWLRFPITDYLTLNKKPYRYYMSCKRFRFWWPRRPKMYFTDLNLFFYRNKKFKSRIWFYKYINNNYNISKSLLYYFSINKGNKLFITFPFYYYTFFFYYLFIYFILNLFLFILYKKICKQSDNIFLYTNNKYLWDSLCDNVLKDNSNWYSNKYFYNYYYKDLLSNKIDFNDLTKKSKSDTDTVLDRKDRSLYYEKNYSEPLLKKEKSLLNIIKYNQYKQLLFIKSFLRYNKLKNILNSRYFKLKSISSSTIKNLNNIYTIPFKLNSLGHITKNDKDSRKIITFNFKYLFFKDNYKWLFNIFLNRKNKINLFFTFFKSKVISLPYIYNQSFEEMIIQGPITFYTNDTNFIYLENKIASLYKYSKWLSDAFFSTNNSPFYFFHKDPNICFVSKDITNTKYYFNNSSEINPETILFDFIFIIIPLLLLYVYIGLLLSISHENTAHMLTKLKRQLTFPICWISSQFEFLQNNFLNIFWGSFENNVNEKKLGRFIVNNGSPVRRSLFPYNYRKEKLFPLYVYLKREYFFFGIYSSYDTKYHYLLKVFTPFYNLIKWYCFDFYNLLHSRFFSLFDIYSYKIIIFYIFKIIIVILIILVLKYKNMHLYFYIFNKYPLNLLNHLFEVNKLYYKYINR